MAEHPGSQLAADALYADAQKTGWRCPPSWSPPWRQWYRKLAGIVVSALEEPQHG